MKIKNQKPSFHLWKRGGRRERSSLRPSKIKNIINVLLILGLILPSFSLAQTQIIKIPETLEEAKEMGEKALKEAQKQFPDILKKIWEEQVLPVWQKMYDWFMTNIWPKIESWFKKEVQPRAKEEIEKRKPIIEEEFKKEKEELEEELPGTTNSLWEKLKEFLK